VATEKVLYQFTEHQVISQILPLYAEPQKREWVGLTDEEMDEALNSCNTTDIYKYFRAIEAKLKEKNA
jgi:hypothetical protein